MSPLRRPPQDLSGFPRYELAATRTLSRIHRADRSPWWSSSDGSGRFDLPAPRGTCYLAEEALGSFVEAFRDAPLVAESDVRKRRLSTVHAPRDATLADCTGRRARAFGITAAIHSSEDYARTQEWARAFADAGFGGIRYFVSHDPAQRLVGIALFGPAGVQDGPATTDELPATLLREARERFGIVVLPTP